MAQTFCALDPERSCCLLEPRSRGEVDESPGLAEMGVSMKNRIAVGFAVAGLVIWGSALAAPREQPRISNPVPFPCPPGFRLLENSDACARVSGHVRGESFVRSPRSRSSDSFASSASGRVQLDVRIPVGSIPLRGVVEAEGRGR